jgi:FkbM family methyltransferase
MKKQVAIYGCGNSGQKLAKNLQAAGVEVSYFIDQRAHQLKVVNSIPCIAPHEVSSVHEQVVLGFFNRDVSPRSIAELLLSKGVKRVIGYHEVNKYFPDSVSPSFWYDSKIDLNDHRSEIEELKSLFQDEESHRVVDQILKYRQTGHVFDHLDGSGLQSQYFKNGNQDWLSRPNLTMVDCGAFDGDTIVGAIENHANISRAFCFEPDQKNFSALLNNVKKQDRIECYCIPCATWSKEELLYFTDGSGESSHLTNNSGLAVQAVSVDHFLGHSKYDFLKIDVEGADLDTLKGAAESIRAHRPYIAVGIYHRPNDLWDIPLYIKKLNCDYKFSLRQHGHNLMDAVLYANCVN